MLFWVVWVDTTEWCRNINIKKLSFQRQKSAIGIPRTLLEFAGQLFCSVLSGEFQPLCICLAEPSESLFHCTFII